MIGAGAIGGVVGARLHQIGHQVTLVARGEHLRVLQASGLRLIDAEEDVLLPVRAVGSVAEIAWQGDEVALVTTKTQDADSVLEDLRRAAQPEIVVGLATNGVEAERLALRRFANVYGVCVTLPATFLEAGMIIANAWPTAGVLQIGRFPGGADPVADRLAAAFSSPRLMWQANHQVMAAKYGKLLLNVRNALDALVGRDGFTGELAERVIAEAVACYAAADIEHHGDQPKPRPEGFKITETVGGHRHQGSSTWQSLAKGSTSTEVDYLNGEVVLLGRLHGVATPVNALLQQVLSDVARRGEGARQLTLDDLLTRLRAGDP